jgi:GGDEF domain-containing protein
MRKGIWLASGRREFAVLLPNTTAEDGLMVAERLRTALEDSNINSGEGHVIRITLSGGIAPLRGSPEHIGGSRRRVVSGEE